MSWRDFVEPVSHGLVAAASHFGGPLAGIIAEAGVDLVKLGIHAADQGLSREATIQQVDDRCVDLMRQLKTDV